jgi:hypothetical protein
MPSCEREKEQQRLLAQLEKLKREPNYAERSARLLDELKQKDQRPRYAIT